MAAWSGALDSMLREGCLPVPTSPRFLREEEEVAAAGEEAARARLVEAATNLDGLWPVTGRKRG